MDNGEFGRPAAPLDPELPSSVAMLLRDESLWETAPAGLWDRVEREISATAAVTDLATVKRTPARRRWVWTAPLTAAAGIVPLALAGVLGFNWGTSAGEAPGPEVAFALSGTEPGAEVSGEGGLRHTPSGLEIRLDVTGLPPAPPDAYYQGWLKGSAGAVTIGTFHARQGGDDIVLWSGVEDLAKYDTLTVTLQDVAGGPASSGKVVLLGEINPE